jgi:lipopolysaccharide export LptBFGC system permease protein LptF
MAYLLVGVSALLIPFHWRSDYQGDYYLALVAAAAMVIVLVLGFCTPRTDRQRFWPFVLGFAFLVIHSLLQKL